LFFLKERERDKGKGSRTSERRKPKRRNAARPLGSKKRRKEIEAESCALHAFSTTIHASIHHQTLITTRSNSLDHALAAKRRRLDSQQRRLVREFRIQACQLNGRAAPRLDCDGRGGIRDCDGGGARRQRKEEHREGGEEHRRARHRFSSVEEAEKEMRDDDDDDERREKDGEVI